MSPVYYLNTTAGGEQTLKFFDFFFSRFFFPPATPPPPQPKGPEMPFGLDALLRSQAKSALSGMVEDGLDSLTFSMGFNLELSLKDLRLQPKFLEDATGLRVLAACVRDVKIVVTGGIAGLLSGRPIKVIIDGIYLLLGSMPSPKKDEAARKEAAEQVLREARSFLDLERKGYEQRLLPLLFQALGKDDPAMKDAGEGGFVQKIIDGAIASGEIDITRIHIRYEDAQLGSKPFAVGVTLGRFLTTQSDLSGAKPRSDVPRLQGRLDPPSAPKKVLTYRDANLDSFALYWDPLVKSLPWDLKSRNLGSLQPLLPPPGAKNEAWGPWYAAMAAGVEVPPGFSVGAAAAGGGSSSALTALPPKHFYVLAPISPALAMALNLKNSPLPGARPTDPRPPLANVSVRVQLALGLNPRQMAAAKALGAFMGYKGSVVDALRQFPPPAWSPREALRELQERCAAAGGGGGGGGSGGRVLYVQLRPGVQISLGDDGGEGTEGSPCATIHRALQLAGWEAHPERGWVPPPPRLARALPPPRPTPPLCCCPCPSPQRSSSTTGRRWRGSKGATGRTTRTP